MVLSEAEIVLLSAEYLDMTMISNGVSVIFKKLICIGSIMDPCCTPAGDE